MNKPSMPGSSPLKNVLTRHFLIEAIKGAEFLLRKFDLGEGHICLSECSQSSPGSACLKGNQETCNRSLLVFVLSDFLFILPNRSQCIS